MGLDDLEDDFFYNSPRGKMQLENAGRVYFDNEIMKKLDNLEMKIDKIAKMVCWMCNR